MIGISTGEPHWRNPRGENRSQKSEYGGTKRGMGWGTKSDPEKGDASINYKATRKHLGIRILPEIRVTKKFLRDSLAVWLYFRIILCPDRLFPRSLLFCMRKKSPRLWRKPLALLRTWIVTPYPCNVRRLKVILFITWFRLVVILWDDPKRDPNYNCDPNSNLDYNPTKCKWWT